MPLRGVRLGCLEAVGALDSRDVITYPDIKTRVSWSSTMVAGSRCRGPMLVPVCPYLQMQEKCEHCHVLVDNCKNCPVQFVSKAGRRLLQFLHSIDAGKGCNRSRCARTAIGSAPLSAPSPVNPVMSSCGSCVDRAPDLVARRPRALYGRELQGNRTPTASHAKSREANSMGQFSGTVSGTRSSLILRPLMARGLPFRRRLAHWMPLSRMSGRVTPCHEYNGPFRPSRIKISMPL